MKTLYKDSSYKCFFLLKNKSGKSPIFETLKCEYPLKVTYPHCSTRKVLFFVFSAHLIKLNKIG